MEMIRMLIVADDPLVRAGLAMLLGDISECEIVGQISSQTLMKDLADDDVDLETPQVLIWDAGWEVPELLPDWQEVGLPVIALLPEEVEVERVWASGVRGILSRDTDSVSLIIAAHTAVNGMVVLDQSFAENLLPIPHLMLFPDSARETLTEREEEVLNLVAEGLTNKAIASQLHISDHTVKFHVNSIMTKLGAQSRTDAVVRATRLGLIHL
jgi:DNA-binding NarL/FixJ family response regulator